jgi:hypothetical protein
LKTIAEFIEQIKIKYNHNSYYETMSYLGMDRQSWTKIKKGGGISEKNCIRVASALKMDPIELMAISNALKAPNNEIKNIWLKLAREKEEKRISLENRISTENT